MTLTIEEGRYYRTRLGYKAGPIRDDHAEEGQRLSYIDHEGRERWVNRDGLWMVNGDVSDLDLVALWTEEPAGPVRTRTVTTTEIIAGTFDRLAIEPGIVPQGAPVVAIDFTSRAGVAGMDNVFTAPELTAIITTLTAVRDALEAQS